MSNDQDGVEGAKPGAGREAKVPEIRSLVIDRGLLFRLSFFALFAYLLYQLALIFSPFLTTLMAAATLVFIFQPVHVRLLRWLGGRRTLAAALGTAGLLLVIIIPALTMAWLFAGQVVESIPTFKTWLQRYHEGGATAVAAAMPASVAGVVDHIDAFLESWGVDFEPLLVAGLEKLRASTQGIGESLVTNILSVAINVALLAIGIFFFMRDGAKWMRTIEDVVPLAPQHKVLLLKRLDETLSAVVRGQLVTAGVQGLLATVGFAIVGLPSAILLGFATTFLSVIPFIGAAGVWLPCALYLFVVGRPGAGVFMLVWGVLVISLIDNFLKPLLIGGKAHIPTFLLFFGILGGLQVYGFLGIILGPLLIGLLLTFVAIYREEIQQGSRQGDSRRVAPVPDQGQTK